MKLWKICQKMKKYWNGKKGKTGKFWKNLVESDKIWKTLVESGKMWKIWCKVGKFGQSLKSGNIWEYFKKYWNGKKSKNGKLWKNLVESGKIWKTWWTVEKICKSLKSGKICETAKSVKKWKILKRQKREHWKIV